MKLLGCYSLLLFCSIQSVAQSEKKLNSIQKDSDGRQYSHLSEINNYKDLDTIIILEHIANKETISWEMLVKKMQESAKTNIISYKNNNSEYFKFFNDLGIDESFDWSKVNLNLEPTESGNDFKYLKSTSNYEGVSKAKIYKYDLYRQGLCSNFNNKIESYYEKEIFDEVTYHSMLENYLILQSFTKIDKDQIEANRSRIEKMLPSFERDRQRLKKQFELPAFKNLLLLYHAKIFYRADTVLNDTLAKWQNQFVKKRLEYVSSKEGDVNIKLDEYRELLKAYTKGSETFPIKKIKLGSASLEELYQQNEVKKLVNVVFFSESDELKGDETIRFINTANTRTQIKELDCFKKIYDLNTRFVVLMHNQSPQDTFIVNNSKSKSLTDATTFETYINQIDPKWKVQEQSNLAPEKDLKNNLKINAPKKEPKQGGPLDGVTAEIADSVLIYLFNADIKEEVKHLLDDKTSERKQKEKYKTLESRVIKIIEDKLREKSTPSLIDNIILYSLYYQAYLNIYHNRLKPIQTITNESDLQFETKVIDLPAQESSKQMDISISRYHKKDTTFVTRLRYVASKRQKIGYSLGMIWTLKPYSTLNVNYDSSKIVTSIVGEEVNRFSFITMLHYYPFKGLLVKSKHPFNKKEWWTDLSVNIGTSVPDVTSQVTLGLSYDIIPGARVSAGALWIKNKRYNIQNNKVLQTKLIYDARPYVGILLQPVGIVNQISKVIKAL
jgi:hypothetical protein